MPACESSVVVGVVMFGAMTRQCGPAVEPSVELADGDRVGAAGVLADGGLDQLRHGCRRATEDNRVWGGQWVAAATDGF